MTPDKPQMPEEIYVTPRGSGTCSGVYVDLPMGDEPRGEHKYIRADLARAPLPDDRARALAWFNTLKFPWKFDLSKKQVGGEYENYIPDQIHDEQIRKHIETIRAALSASVPAVDVEALKREAQRTFAFYSERDKEVMLSTIEYLAPRGLLRSASVEDIEGLDEALKFEQQIFADLSTAVFFKKGRGYHKELEVIVKAAKLYLSQTGRLDVKGGE